MIHISVSGVIAAIAVMISEDQLQVPRLFLHPVHSAIPRSMGVIYHHNLEEGDLPGRFAILVTRFLIEDFCVWSSGVMENAG